MNLKGRPLVFLLIIWMFTVPTGIAYLLLTQPLPELNIGWIGLSILLGFLSIYYPIIYKGKSIILFVWFTLPIFFMYGLTTELLVTQLIVVLAVIARFKKGELLYRLLYNSLAYFIISTLSACAFFLTGAEIGSLDFGLLAVGAFAYQLIYSLLYDGIFFLYGTLTKRMRQNTFQETIYHYMRLIIVVPLALSLYYLLHYYGFIGYLLIGIPFFSITTLLRRNNYQEDLNGYIQEAGKIGRQLAKTTNEKEVTEEYLTKAAALFHADYVYLYDECEGWLEPSFFYMKGVKNPPPEVRLQKGQGVAGRLLSEKKSEFFSRREQWIDETVTFVPEDMESLLCVPLLRRHQVVRVLVLGSSKRDAFKEFHLHILDLLSSYFVVSVEKAKYIQLAELESERCALTGLHNYRSLERYLEKEVNLVREEKLSSVSVVMLDVDYFKKVNDTYGHESGNMILKQLATLLTQHCPENGLVARYGGEEFVYVLPQYSKTEAVEFAETVRKAVETTSMQIINELGDRVEPKYLSITSSFGVSSAPEDTDEAMTLLRNADRALYIGAKQAGRNRVGSYMK